MFNAKKLICLVLVLIVIFALTGCTTTAPSQPDTAENNSASNAANSPAPSQTDGKQVYIAAFSKGYQHQFWVRNKEGMEAACAEYGARLTYEAPDSGQNVNVQIDQIDAALGRDPNALLIASIDATAIVPSIEKAVNQGIPVFTFDSGSNTELVKAFYGTGNKAGGALAAENMAKFLGGKGDVAIVANDQVSNSIIDRRDGFVEYMEQNYPDIKVVDIQYNADDSLKSTDICTTFLLSYKDLKGIYACGQSSTEGMIKAVDEQGMSGKIVCVGFDSGEVLLNAIKSGTLTGAVTQDPYNMGYICAKAACELVINGKEPEQKTNDSGSAFYTKDNVDSEKIQGMVYR